MPDIRQTQAYVLRTVAFGERDVIITLYGKDHGRFSALARGARSSSRRFGGSLMPLRELHVDYTVRPGRDLSTLNEATVLRDFPGIETDYDKITIASYVTELVRATTREGMRGEDVYDLLGDVFDHIARSEPSPAMFQILVRHFELRLLQAVGAAPSLDGCYRCGREVEHMDKLRCSRDGEGLVCLGCAPQVSRFGILEPNTLNALAYLADPSGPAPEALTLHVVRQQIRRVLDSSLSRVLDDTPLKSRGLVDSLLEVSA